MNHLNHPEKPLQYENYSCYLRLKRVIAWCLRFKNNAIKKNTTKTGELNAIELQDAEMAICRIAQAESFCDELNDLIKKQSVTKSSHIYKLSPYLDQDLLIRINGRIDAATAITEYARRPIILAKEHPLTALIVRQYHVEYKHQNQETIVCAIRQRYWIPHLRTLVKREKNKCMLCRLRSAKPSIPIMGPLPEDRVTPCQRPFTYTGLDYFGPVYVTVGRRQEKRWVALFTCLTVRAVHLELAKDLSTYACIICLRNFINIRGVPRRIRSDNGTNFVGMQKELRNAIGDLDSNIIQQVLVESNGSTTAQPIPRQADVGNGW